ncbi:MAG: alpha/beta hydrolase [Deltaproteobacteria bacterium]|nr:MAG: alpha/beta hydrolase [Deltaproteobacteria bacterium]
MARRGRGLARLGATVVALCLGIAVLSRFVDRMIFYPTPGVDLTPAELGVPAEEVFLRTADGVRIHAFYLPAPGETRALLFLHGNAGNASHRLPNAAALAELGTHVLLLDYRGYGRSEGSPSEAGVYADARAGLAHLVDARGFDERRIVAFGRSIGGAVAVDLAQGRALAGLVLESTFSSIGDVAASIFGGLPLGALVRGRFDSAAKIGRVRCPLLFLHGDRDRVIPIELGRRLFEIAPDPKVFEVLAGAGHNDTVLVGGRPYLERIRRFLDRVAPR